MPNPEHRIMKNKSAENYATSYYFEGKGVPKRPVREGDLHEVRERDPPLVISGLIFYRYYIVFQNLAFPKTVDLALLIWRLDPDPK